jgi:solute carrier family 25 phosphate transporter 3
MKIFLAGGTGCCLSHAAAIPFDVVKTRQQSSPMRYSHSGTGKPLGTRATGRQIVREEGFWALLQGIGPTLVGYGVQGAVKYSLWEVFKVIFGFDSATGCGKVLVLVAAAFVAEIFASALLCPFERLRIRLVADPAFSRGGLPQLTKALSEDGFRKTLYGKGLGSMLIKQTAYTVAKLTVFTLISDSLRYYWTDPGAYLCQLSKTVLFPRMAVTLLASLLAGIVAGIASQPGDTLMTCMSTDSTLREACPVDAKTGGPPGTLQMAHALGWEGLFTGWRARLIHVEVIVVTQLFIYDAIKHAVGL